MSTLPPIPGCGGPATVRLEIYSRGSLDGAAYACQHHAPSITALIESGGWSAQAVVLAPDIERPCGHVYRYATGRLAVRVPADHPSWCSRESCRERRQHRSRRLPVGTGRPEAVLADVALVAEDVPGTGVAPMVVVRASEDDVCQEIVLSTAQAAVLAHRIRQLLDRTVKRHRNGRWRSPSH
ncbi:hypothetical protein AB0H63_27305 [Micromonospora echinospora]|uniref:hypothetical protein n=1 Tax=Micromonospora echinospora TaxID=1877 RepID=UPI00340EFC73